MGTIKKIDKLFHITPGSNLPLILAHGLLPDQDNCMARINKKWNMLFLTDDVDHIINTQLTDNWIDRYKPIVLSVDISQCQIKPRYSNHQDPPVLVPHEFVCFHAIDPCFISILASKVLND